MFGFLKKCASAAGRAVSSVASGVKKVASAVWEGAKKVATKVVNTVAEYGGKVVDTVKKVYRTVKPYLKHAKAALSAVATATAVTFPWVSGAAVILAKGVDFLDKIGNSKLAEKVGRAIEWAIKALEFIKKKFFDRSEMEEAIERQEELQEAYDQMQTEEQRQSVRYAMLINDYMIVRTRIEEALESFEESNSTNFDHYLRLRATQKLLKMAERRLHNAKDVKEISKDDLFLIQVGAELLAEEPNLSDEQLLQLDQIIQRRFDGKKLLPFVFEELLFSWNCRLDDMTERWNKKNTELAKLKRELKSLEVKQKIEDLSVSEVAQLAVLREEIMEQTYELKEQENNNRSMEYYINASEGFLQVLEKDEGQWIDEGREWVLDESSEMGMLLIRCVEQGVRWDELEPEQQSLIRDFANVFAQDGKQRTSALKANLVEEVEVV